MKPMKLVYVAGKYRDDKPFKIQKNIHNAWCLGVDVLGIEGLFPIIPHCNTINMDGCASDKTFLEGTLETMRRCDAVIVLENNHETSEGTLGEIEGAKKLNIPVFFDIEELKKWASDNN